MIEWNIQSRAHHCQACHKLFADQELFHTLLFDQKHSYQRLDVCQACWDSQYSHGATDRKGFLSYWQGFYSAPAPAPLDAIQKENAESLLRKLIERNDPSHEGALFVLAVMLERKRLFKVKAQLQIEGRRAFVYEHSRTGDVFTIPDPHLVLDQLEAVQRDVAHLLEHGLDSPPGAAAPSPAPDAAATVPPDGSTTGPEAPTAPALST